MSRIITAILLVTALVGCRGDKQMGDPCSSGDECAEPGLCAGGVQGPDPVCTRSCASNTDCPEGWSCSGGTEDMVLVCVHRASTPFGH